MAHVLCALENAKSQRSEEISGRKQTSCGTQCESGVLAQEVADLAQLRDTILTENSLFLELGKGASVLGTSVLWHQIDDGVEHRAPGFVLHVGVVNGGDGVATGFGKQMRREWYVNII